MDYAVGTKIFILIHGYIYIKIRYLVEKTLQNREDLQECEEICLHLHET